MPDSVRPLPPELASPQVQELLDQGRSSGYVTSGDVRSAFDAAGIAPGRMKAVLRSLHIKAAFLSGSAGLLMQRRQTFMQFVSGGQRRIDI